MISDYTYIYKRNICVNFLRKPLEQSRDLFAAVQNEVHLDAQQVSNSVKKKIGLLKEIIH